MFNFLKEVDRPLLYTFIGLWIFGVVMIWSVSIYESYLITNSATNSFFLKKAVIFLILSIILLLIVAKIPYKFWKKVAPIIFFTSFVLLIALFIPWLTNDYWSARSWLNIPFLPSIQPSEIMKLWLILYFTLWIESKTNKIATLKEWFFPFAFLLWVIVLLIWMQPDFWAVLVIWFIAWSMFFIWWWNLWHILWAGFLAIWAAMPIILSHEYIYKRFLAFLDPQYDIDWSWYQIMQALMTIWSWGFWWVWFGQSVQKFWYLPEVQWDTIFAVAAEELWFVRILLLVWAYLFIAYRWLQIANRAPDKFWMLLATWITAWIVFQAFINISVNIAIMPLTWLTLPFVSYWWTSLMMMMIASWILLSVSRKVKR